MRSWIQNLVETLREDTAQPQLPPGVSPDLLGEMVKEILTTTDDEIDCNECFVQLDQFVDMHLAGKSPAEALPLVQAHLTRCHDCREEFEALLLALQVVE